MSTRIQGETLGIEIIVGAAAGFLGAWAMSAFQQSWVRASDTKRRQRPRTDEEVMQEVVRRVIKAAGGKGVARRDLELAGRLLHYGLGISTGVLYTLLARKSKLVSRGFGSVFGTAMYAVLDPPAPQYLRPFVNDNEIVSRLYEWFTHVIYGVTLESSRRGAQAMLNKIA